MVPTIIGVSNADGITPVTIYVDPTTHRMLVSAAAGALSGLTDVQLTGTAQGDILYHNGTKWVNLAAGTSGKFLKTQGAGANPTWASVVTTYARSATLVIAASDSKDVTNADYICDGVADDVQINAALAALPTRGGQVKLMEGTFNLAAKISITRSNVVLSGQGAASTKLVLGNGVNDNMIGIDDLELGSYTDIVVENLWLEGNSANQTGNQAGIFIGNTIQRFIIRNNYIHDTKISQIYDDGADYGLIADNYLDTVSVGASYGNIEGVGDYTVIRGNTCVAGDYAGISIYNDSAGRVIVEGNKVINSAGYGIESLSDMSIIVNNQIVDSGDYSIYVHGSTNYNVVANNHIEVANNPSSSVILRVSSSQSEVSGNVIEVRSGNTAALTAINIGADNVNTNGNYVYFGTSQAHIGLSVSNGYSSITNNSVQGQGGGTEIGFQISASEAMVTGNTVFQMGTGMDCTGCDTCVFSNNNMTSIQGKAMILTGTLLCEVIGNKIDSCEYGIYIANTSTATRKQLNISNNLISSITKEGIFLQGVTYSIVSGNKLAQVGTGTNNTYAGIFITSTGVAYSVYNVISNNHVDTTNGNAQKYGIRENSTNDGPNVIVGNICIGAGTTNISPQHASTDTSHNITT